MRMESLIELSKNLTEHLLSKKRGKLGKEYYFMFSVSKFILLKEKILKKGFVKNPETNKKVTVFKFNNLENKKYIPVIMDLYNYIKTNGSFKIKEEQVQLENPNSNQKELVTALLVLNKLRDSIAHGKYSFDFDNESLVVDNDNTSKGYRLICSIPFVLLNKFSFFIEELEDKDVLNEEELLIKYYKYLNDLSSIYKFNPKVIYNNMILNEDEYIKKIELLKYNNKLNYIPTSETINKIVNEMNLKELNYLIKLLEQYNPKNNFEETLIQRIFSEYDLIISRKLQLEEELEKNDKETRQLISEIKKILKIKDRDMIIDSVPTLYNYMCLSFSLEPNIDYLFLSTEGLDIECRDKNYKEIIESIRTECKEFKENRELEIEKYYREPNDVDLKKLIVRLAKFYYLIVKKYNAKNSILTTSIRNSIEHGNFFYINNGNILLYDLRNQWDISTIKFTCSSNVEDLFAFTNQVNDKKIKEKYNLNMFFQELKKIISEELYIEIFTILNELSNIAIGKDLDLDCSMKMYIKTIATALKGETKKR